MKIHYLFSRNKKIGSKIIAWGSKFEDLPEMEIPSHAAVLMNEQMVIESVFGSGVRLVPYSKWLEINEQLYKIPCDHERTSREVIDQLLRLWGKSYDWRGIMFFAWSFLKLILHKKPLPYFNKWERKSHLFCIELVGKLSGVYHSMTSPAKMCARLLGHDV